MTERILSKRIAQCLVSELPTGWKAGDDIAICESGFSSAFFELFVHELLIRQGFDLQLHPPLPSLSHRPDFLVKRDDWEFYVKAVDVKDRSEDENARANKEEHFFEGLNRLKSAHYYLQIQNLEFLSDRQPQIQSTQRMMPVTHQTPAHH